MTSRELVVTTLNHEPCPRVPRDFWLAANADRIDEWNELGIRYPSDILSVGSFVPGKKARNKGDERTDAWGCVWRQGGDGGPDELKQSPLSDASKIASYRPPAEALENNRFAKASKQSEATDRFVLAWSEVRPFDRLRWLRGDAALKDLGRGTKDIRSLAALVHDFARQEMEHWANSQVDGVVFRDDWATPERLRVSINVWQTLFRPMYRDYCRILRDADKFVFFHGKGNLAEIFDDLVDVGIDAIHVPFSQMDLLRLAERYRGYVTFWIGLDAERLRNPGASDEFRRSVLEVRHTLDSGAGGVIAECRWDAAVRLQTVAGFFDQWLMPLSVRV